MNGILYYSIAFQALLKTSEEHEMMTREGTKIAGLSVEFKLLLTIWTLANQESFRQLGDRFGIPRGYAHYIFKQCCGMLAVIGCKNEIIKWPTNAQTENLVRDNNFPGGFAAVGGCHIHIKTPTQYAESYVNRKSYASVVLQAVCTKDLKFVDVSTGWPGSMHDARIYEKHAFHDTSRGCG